MDEGSRPWWFQKQDTDLTEYPEAYEPMEFYGKRHRIVLSDGTQAFVWRPDLDS